MSLATRCPACHTVFRVVQDQLRVSEGWVRCGQCQEVFNALETLFDVGPLGVADPAITAPPAAEDSAVFEGDGSIDAAPEPISLDDLAAAPVAEPAPRPNLESIPQADLAEAPVANASEITSAIDAPMAAAEFTGDDEFEEFVVAPLHAGEWDRDAEADDFLVAPLRPQDTEQDPEPGDDAPTPSRFMGPIPDWARQPRRERRTRLGKSRAPLAAAEMHAQAHHSSGTPRRRRKPDFVRQAERAAMWRRPSVRVFLGGAGVLLAATLVLQIGYRYRDPLAAQAPALAPSLHAACDWVGCRIGPPRAIEHIRLDASDLTRTDEDQVLRLTAEVHNTAAHAVRTPALDVNFTDAYGRTLSRKVIMAAELGVRSDAIAADGHWHVDARLAVGDLRVAGYTVELFYP